MKHSRSANNDDLQDDLDRIARLDRRAFCERVLRNPRTGEYVVLAPIHDLMLRHIQKSWDDGFHAGVILPWSSGKTILGVVSTALFELGQNPGLRIKVVSSNDHTAMARVQTISEYILRDNDYRRIFANVRPAVETSSLGASTWTAHRIVLNRPVPSPDASVEAWGVLASNIGGRCDLMLCDDIVDGRNALLMPSMREQVKDAFSSGWIRGMEPPPYGRIAYFGTVWHEDDLTADLMEKEGFAWLVVAVSEALDCYDCRYIQEGRVVRTFTMPLWDKWNQDALKQRKKIMIPREFDRGFRQIAYSDDDITFPHFQDAIKPGARVADIVKDSWPAFVGVDISGKARKGTVIFVLRVDPETRMRVPVEVLRGKWSSPVTAERLQYVYNRYEPLRMLVENNALQGELIEWCRTDPVKWTFNRVLDGYMTGAQKMDPSIGLPSLDLEFSLGHGTGGGWTIPGGDFETHDPSCTCGWCWWVREMRQHPFADQEDTAMACWIAREAARMYFRHPTKMKPGGAKLVRRRSVSVEARSFDEAPERLSGVLRWGKVRVQE